MVSEHADQRASKVCRCEDAVLRVLEAPRPGPHAAARVPDSEPSRGIRCVRTVCLASWKRRAAVPRHELGLLGRSGTEPSAVWRSSLQGMQYLHERVLPRPRSVNDRRLRKMGRRIALWRRPVLRTRRLQGTQSSSFLCSFLCSFSCTANSRQTLLCFRNRRSKTR